MEILRQEAECFPHFPPYRLIIVVDPQSGRRYACKNIEEARAVDQILKQRRYQWRQY
jgi:hypothetical protein